MLDILFGTLYTYINNINLFFLDYFYAKSEGSFFDITFPYDYLLTNIYFFLIIIILDIITLSTGRTFYTKFNIKREFNNIKLLAYIFRFIPILSHIGSFLLGFNKIEKKIVIKHLIKGYSIYTVLMYSIFFLFSFFSVDIPNIIVELFFNFGSFIIGLIGIIYSIYFLITKKLGKKQN